MNISLPSLRHSRITRSVSLATVVLVILIGIFFVSTRVGAAEEQAGRLITIHDRGEQTVLLSEGDTIADALNDAGVIVDARDAVEPALTEKLVATEYQVNIYRARPVTVIDGSKRQKVMTAYQTSEQIVKDLGIELFKEDLTTTARSTNLVSDGAGLQLTIDRAVPFQLELYGAQSTARTQAATVGEMIEEKGIKIEENDRVSVGLDTEISSDLSVRIWREGRQTTTVEEAVAFDVEQIRDADRPIGYKAVQTPGVEGKRNVTYEIEIINGEEVSRTEISSFVTTEPSKQIEVIGAKPGNGLTKGKGVNHFADSNGVVHRETYYDLPMARVMQNCGQGGFYTVREDGAKVDREGYVIIAANLALYPRCSVVETSLGPGKVYDTGGFASVHPHGWDLATDWTNYNGI